MEVIGMEGTGKKYLFRQLKIFQIQKESRK